MLVTVILILGLAAKSKDLLYCVCNEELLEYTFFLQATSLCVQGQKMLNHFHNFYPKSCVAVAYEIFNIPLNEAKNLTKSFYTNIYTAFIQTYTQLLYKHIQSFYTNIYTALRSVRITCVATLLTSTSLLILISATCKKPFILLKSCLSPSNQP